MPDKQEPLVGVVMGSSSDWAVMRHAVEQLELFNIPHEYRVVSAHRTPDLLYEYASSALDRGLACIIAGAGGSAHLPGMLAAKTTIPILGVPVPSKHLHGQDSLYSIVQMPKGIPGPRALEFFIRPVAPLALNFRPRQHWFGDGPPAGG